MYRLLLLIAWLLTTSAAAATAQETHAAARATIDEIARATLEPGKAVRVSALALAGGPATFRLEEGVVIPASPVAGRVVELVFLGQGRVELEAADDVEAAQLELHTGADAVDEGFTAAVLMIANDDATTALFDREPAALETHDATRADELWRVWRDSSERRQLALDATILADALGDPIAQSAFVAWLEGENLGRFLYLVDPDAREQVTLARFEPLDLERKEEKSIKKALHKEQRQGRLVGARFEDLGYFDTWTSTSLTAANGTPRPGVPAFESRHYTLDVAVGERGLELAGTARLRLAATTGGRRVVRLRLYRDLLVDEARMVSEAGEPLGRPLGEPLPLLRLGEDLAVVLDEAPAAGTEIELELRYRGRLFEREGRTWASTHTIDWYPHAGSVDRASYDVTLRWPEGFDLVAGGSRVGGGVDPEGRRWERRELREPALAFGFEIGRFRLESRQTGHVRLTLASDKLARKLIDKGERQLILDTAADVLVYFEHVFGPYPRDELTLVTMPRAFSQSLPGLVTLSTLNMADLGLLGRIFGFQDRRTIIAHELAHQWWGNRVGWVGYRDQWISEAMASYAAMLWARNRLPAEERPRRGPTWNWHAVLTDTTDDGRTIESLGPVVLGSRLTSSKADGYQAIVYKKGAILLDMLADAFGENEFLVALGKLVEEAGGLSISTENFFALLSRITAADLEPFTAQYVYGTGFPEIYYEYDFERRDGGWAIVGEARQQNHYRYRYRVVERDGGALDVLREPVTIGDVASGFIVVPVQIAVHDPDRPPPEGARKRGRGGDATPANVVVRGRLLLRGERTPIEIELPFEPKELWLDRDSEALARFYDQRERPKRALYFRGLERAAAGVVDEARALYRDALAAPVAAEPPAGRQETREQEDEARLLDALIQLGRCRLALDRGDVDEAAAAHRSATASLEGARKLRRALERPLELYAARLDLHRGDPAAALERLERHRVGGAEGQLLRAVAAATTGRYDVLAKALEKARRYDVDVALLEDDVR